MKKYQKIITIKRNYTMNIINVSVNPHTFEIVNV